MSFDRKTLHAIAELADEVGVLSVYVTVDPRTSAGERPAWLVRVRNELSALCERLRRHGDTHRLAVLKTRLDELEPHLRHLLDPGEPGIGRALFAPVSRDEVHTVALQLPLTDLVTLDPVSCVRPLLAAWNDGAPAGVAAVSALGVRLVDYRFGVARDVSELPYDETTVDWRALAGPAAFIPGHSQRSAPQHDLYARRRAEHLAQFLRGTGAKIATLANDHGWEYLVLTGDDEHVAEVAAGLPRELTKDVVRCSHGVAALTAPRIGAAVDADLATARERSGRRLAEQAREAALSGGAGSYGLADTLAAAASGQLAHLLLDRDRDWRGHRAPDGRRTPFDEVPPGVDPTTLVPESHLAEYLIESALASGAEVTALTGEAAQPLVDGDGVAAILRW